jgi:hypothetical protein
MKLEELEAYFASAELPEYIELEGGVLQIETKTAVESHIRYLKGNPKNRAYKPYFERLVKIYLQVKK